MPPIPPSVSSHHAGILVFIHFTAHYLACTYPCQRFGYGIATAAA